MNLEQKKESEIPKAAIAEIQEKSKKTEKRTVSEFKYSCLLITQYNTMTNPARPPTIYKMLVKPALNIPPKTFPQKALVLL